MAEFAIGVLVFVASWLLVWFWRLNIKRDFGFNPPPCLPSLPLVGSLPFVTLDTNTLHKFLLDQTSKYGNVFGFYIGSSYVVALNGADAIKEALLKRSTDFAGRGNTFIEATYYNFKLNGIIFSNYDTNYRRKHQLYLSILKQFGFGQRLMETRINEEVADLIHQLTLTKGKSFDPNATLAGSVVNVIGSILLGRRYERGSDRQAELLKWLHLFIDGAVLPVQLFPTLRFVPFIRKKVEKVVNSHLSFLNFLKREIDQTLAEIDGGSTVDSFVRQYMLASTEKALHLSVYSSDNDKASEEEGLSEKSKEATFSQSELLFTIRDLVAAGTDTSVQTLRWAIVELTNHPQVQRRLQQEIDTVVGRNRLPSLSDEADMPYAQAVITELMRRRTLIPRALLHKTRCDTRVGNLFIPAEAWVIPNLYSLHMDPKLWDEPEKFRPERFINDGGQVVSKANVIPFSLGKRSCTGELLAKQEVFLFVTGMFQNFNFLPPEHEEKIVVEDRVTSSVSNPSSFRVRTVPRPS